MFIRLKTGASNDVNVNINAIMTFAPNESGDGSVVTFTNGQSLAVQDSTRSIRGYVKKALASVNSGGATETEDTPTAG